MFYNDLENIFVKEGIQPQENIIWGGDFNIVFDKDMDRKGGAETIKKKSKQMVEHLQEEYFLQDIWRVKNYGIKRCTWRQ